MSRTRFFRALLREDVTLNRRIFTTSSSSSQSSNIRIDRLAKGLLKYTAVITASAAAVVYALDKSVVKAEAQKSVHAPGQSWSFRGTFSSLDHSSIRRGWQVYKTVCSTCHSLQYVAFKDLVNVCLTEQEAREAAAEFEVEDGPNEQGEYFMRPCKLSDCIPNPFPNEQAARVANGGAYPVDLTYILNARHHGPDYVFGLLTGYIEEYCPAGLELRDGQAFNPYFEGGAIGMPEMLQDDGVDYDDGTPAYKSQMAKDVVEFLNWTGNQEWDTRKVMGMKVIGIGLILIGSIYPILRRKMSIQKKTKIYFDPRHKRC